MSNNEKYYFNFKYIDGTTQEFEQDDDKLSEEIKSNDNGIIQVDNVFINLANVIKVTTETKSQREHDAEQRRKKNARNLDAFNKMIR